MVCVSVPPLNFRGYPSHSKVLYLSSASGTSIKHRALCITVSAKRRCMCYDFHDQLIQYKDAWSLQNTLVKHKKALLDSNQDPCDSLVILQHPPVYTLGTRSSERFLHFNVDESPIDIFRTERGGEVTYHGPGQLVMYPIMNLRHHKMDLHWYLRALEDVVIHALSSTFSLKASRIEGLTGVWVGNQKIAAIGIRVSRWISYHGLALNVTTDLTPFNNIVPCGISDHEVGNIYEILKITNQIEKMQCDNSNVCEESWDADSLLELTYTSILKEFSDVFQVDLIQEELDAMKGIPITKSCT
eukprot:TRINITY_DN4712_c0_g1_i2.p1 TRINITY_DN4712_c0_g1~~TRINITY_DN4712_c0_g1_i2.p1  ORF type:complete len:300 (-),score=42.04 TRINITY_DN4712_c0_g1_i2:221-1120(-)